MLSRRGLTDKNLDPFLAVATALTVYGLAESLGMYGFVAAFAAGMGYRRFEFSSGSNRRFHTGAHVSETLLELGVLILFGAYLTLDVFLVPGWPGWLLVALLILFIRPVLVMAFGRGHMNRAQRVFVAFFGVRGIGSLFYASAALGTHVLSDNEELTIFWTVAAAVASSVLVFGVSATPLTRRLLAH